MKLKWTFAILLICCCCLFAASAPVSLAGVSAEEAAKLKSTLTPLGGERAGNKEGTIPAWEGGYTTVWPGYKSGDPKPEPFPDEKPIVSIDSKNMDEYADKLSEGVKEWMKTYPDFRIDVYPTHRTAAAPEYVYENTFKNATRARTTDGGNRVEGAFGGIPFPIPKTGNEAMWNHLLAWRGAAYEWHCATWIIARNGERLVGSKIDSWSQSPYYYESGAPENYDGTYQKTLTVVVGPPQKAGEQIMAADTTNGTRTAYQYLVGQRRVRRAPQFEFDAPNLVTSGFAGWDEAFMFYGSLRRYNWKILGKREMYVPYNTNKTFLADLPDVAGNPDWPHFVNPDNLRWELHRVWEVEATLIPGKRHSMPRRRFYLDEDSWFIMLTDGWDARGQFWKFGHAVTVLAPEFPAVIGMPYVLYDRVQGGYLMGVFTAGQKEGHYAKIPLKPEDFYTPENMAALGTR